MIDPIHCHYDGATMCEDNLNLGWCFWDEISACHGPFNTHDEAVTNHKIFMEALENGTLYEKQQ